MRMRCARLVLRGADAVLSAVRLLQRLLGSFCVEDASVERVNERGTERWRQQVQREIERERRNGIEVYIEKTS